MKKRNFTLEEIDNLTFQEFIIYKKFITIEKEKEIDKIKSQEQVFLATKVKSSSERKKLLKTSEKNIKALASDFYNYKNYFKMEEKLEKANELVNKLKEDYLWLQSPQD